MSKEITEYDIEQGEIVYRALKNLLPDEAIKKMEYLVKNVGWEAAQGFISPYQKKLPKEIVELNLTALKYLHHKYQSESTKN